MVKKLSQNFLYKKNLLQQIRGFCYTARYKSISQAARAMNLTQSTVTLQIQSLERDLKLNLLKREGKKLALTLDGEEFYKIACPLMYEFESLIERFTSQKIEKERKIVDIAMHHIAISYMMPQIVANFKKIYPKIELVIRNIAPSEAVKRLKEGQVDLAFYPNLPNEAEIKQTEVISFDPVLIINNKHPLAKKPIKNISDLQNFDLIRIDKNLITLPLFEEAVKTYGIKGSIEFENGNWEMLKHFVSKNNFAAIVSDICIDDSDKNLVAKNLSQFFPKMRYRISTKNGEILKPIVSDLFEVIKNTANDFKRRVK